MTKSLLLLLALASAMNQNVSAQEKKQTFDAAAAERFARLALACVHKEYPNKIAHSMNSDADVAPPRKLTPAFYGCYDWHSSVHGHWLLVRLVRKFPDAPFTPDALTALRASLTADNIRQEAAYLNAEGRASFERPYGLAWFLQLAAEVHEWEKQEKNPVAAELSVNLRPLEDAGKARLKNWLPKLSYPIRIGEHNQTAFSLGLMIDYAKEIGDREFLDMLVSRTKYFFLRDKNCPLAYEPSGEDFLSPCFAQADVMRRVLAPAEFAKWLGNFMPGIPLDGSTAWLKPEVSPDRSDPKLAHIDGLNLSRAWMLEGIASGLPALDGRVASIRNAATTHTDAGLAAVTGEHYEGGHWLGSFAVYLVTKRGL